MKEIFRLRWRLFVFQCFFLVSFVSGQTVVTGKITGSSDGEPLPGVNIVEKGTTNGTVTDLDGNYTISVQGSSSTLIFSFIGYIEQEAAVGNQNQINVTLEEDIAHLEEIVVIGYGGIKKKEVTGAVASVKSEDILKNASSDVGQSLQGQIAGVSVQASSGAPGAQANIQIRGVGSFSASSVNPLYVIDGIPQEGVPNITPEEIATLNVLKDGASAAAYGTRASNGVILIETKKGKDGPMKVSYSAYYGIQNITSGVDLLNTPEQIFVYEQEAQVNNGHGASVFINSPDALKYDNDFPGYLQVNNAPMTNHTLSLTGGKKDANIYMVTNYFSQDGVLRNSGYRSLSTRINGRLEKNRFSAGASIGVKMDNQEVAPWGIYEQAIIQRPYSALPEDGNSAVIDENPSFFSGLSMYLSNDDKRRSNSINASVNLKYEIIKGLTYQINAGGDIYNYERTYWQPQFIIYTSDGDIQENATRHDARLRKDYRYRQKWTVENLLNYNKTFGYHNIKLTAGYTNEGTNNNEEQVEKADFISNTTQVFSAGNTNTLINGTAQDYGLVGMLGRVIYSYREKYIASFVVRRDGSSNFGEDYKKQTFYGGSVGWNVHEESFMKNITFINQLKFRASIAEVGNQSIPPYLYSAAIVPGTNYHFGPEGGENIQSGAIQRGYANPNVQWETNNSKNIGLDASVLSGKLDATVDVYHNSKTDMLIPVDLPPSAGTWIPRSGDSYKTLVTNVGDMVNKGVELTLTYNGQMSDFTWSLGGIFSKNKNEVTKLPENLGEYALGGGKPILATAQSENTTYVQLGQSVPTFLLVPTDGIIRNEEELAAYEAQFTESPNAQVGDLRWVDSNGDSISDAYDRVPVGTPLADFEVGLNFTGNYKGFDLSIQLFYSHGGKIYNGAKALAYQQRRHKDLYYMWLPSNPDSEVPTIRFSPQHRNVSAMSDQFLEDATYLRVRNITLGYTIPKKLLEKVKIEKVRAYINLQNPLTFTKYTGFDPEVGYSTNDYHGGSDAIFSRGVDRGNYPVSRKVLFGLMIDF